MRLLVTGGAGRLGTELVSLITARGDTAIAFDLPQAYWGSVEEVRGVEPYRGDITSKDDVEDACDGVKGVFHLAALLPPNSERDRGLTMGVNVEGTLNLVEEIAHIPDAPIIFTSSTSTYGITARESPPVDEGHVQVPTDYYSESKIEAEAIIRNSGSPYSILRVAPISVADLVELPQTIPYKVDQRVEFIYVEDAARALLSAYDKAGAMNRTFNIAGGETWQMTGSEYIEAFYDALGVDVEPNFSKDYTTIDWYDTTQSLFLGYQRLNFNGLQEKLRSIGKELGLR